MVVLSAICSIFLGSTKQVDIKIMGTVITLSLNTYRKGVLKYAFFA